ncbi:Crp/Fnr family transcriptional regulator [Mucilaginibacter sp.]|jgi:CRP-like cAMP-binding protein|uniref:Crp/Fnr family transcriptional regulator n=1 Tax=Mucilaginibacter sp. TaxID=1882438 RepID=UPI0025D0A692|nr:Crp/Fnr family transcriptional regulator [Mucilaginibacter sp.]
MRHTYPINAMPLLNYLGKLVNLDEAAVQIILNSCKDVLIPKGNTIFNERKRTQYVYFIVSGKARSYYTDFAGKTITWSFHFNEAQSDFKNLFIVDYKSFLTQTPATMYIEALTDIRAIRIGHREIDAKFEPNPIFEQCLRKLHEYAFIAAYDRVFNLLTLSASDRYNKLLRNEPHLLQMFPDKYLASYIGIEPPSLSRIRKNLKSIPVYRIEMPIAG